MAPSIHARLSASSAHRWLECPASVRLEESFEEKETDFTEEGTIAHMYAENAIKNLMDPNNNLRIIPDNKEMKHAVEKYREYIEGIYAQEALSGDGPVLALVEEQVSYDKYAPEGFGTCDCLIISNKTIHVIDFKYGKGVSVSAENNPQLMLYGLGAVVEFSWLFNFQKSVLHIFQPRLGNISESEVSVKDLDNWGKSKKSIAVDAFNGSNIFKAGEHCRFCKAKSVCKARAGETLGSVIDILKDFIVEE